MMLGALVAVMNTSVIRSAYGVDLADPATWPEAGMALVPLADRNYKNIGHDAPTASEPPDPPPPITPQA